MIPCNTINMTLELFTLLLLMTLLLGLLSMKRNTLRERLLMIAVAEHMASVMGDLLAWGFTYCADSVSSFLAAFGNLLTYATSALVYPCLLAVVYICVAGKQKVSPSGRVTTVCILSLSVLNLGLLIVNQWTGFIYRIEDGNRFFWGPLRLVPDDLALLQILLLLVLLLQEAKKPRERVVLDYLCCVALPFFAIIAEHAFPTLMLLYPAASFSMLYLFEKIQFEQEREKLEQEQELAESRARLIEGQVRPHFIFNSLTAIQELCAEDPEKAGQVVGDFSKYLRGNLDFLNGSRMIPFSVELDHIRSYLAVEQADPASRLSVCYELETLDFDVPALSVQSMVENAVRHGIGTRAEGGTVTIAAAETKDAFCVTVRDDGKGMDGSTPQQRTRSHTGIRNTGARIRAQCGGTLDIRGTENGTVVTITIPKQYKGAPER